MLPGVFWGVGARENHVENRTHHHGMRRKLRGAARLDLWGLWEKVARGSNQDHHDDDLSYFHIHTV